MLAVAPSGRRYVFAYALDTASGSLRTRFTHDESGWWIELTNDLGVRRPEVDALIAAFDPASLPADDKVAPSVRTKASASLSPTQIAYAEGNEHEALASQLMDSTLRTTILREAPAGMTDDLGFFEAAFRIENEFGFEFRPVVSLLRALLGEKPPTDSITVDASRPVKGTAITDPRRSAFAGAFLSVADPREALSRRHLRH